MIRLAMTEKYSLLIRSNGYKTVVNYKDCAMIYKDYNVLIYLETF